MQYADAMRNVTLTEQNNATQIAQAQLAVREAQRQASASMNQFAYDMGKLTKPAQAVVNELLGMHGAVRGLEDIAQQTVLPGIVIFLNGVKSILPEVRTGMKLMGTAMGDSFGQFGKLMQTPAFKDGLPPAPQQRLVHQHRAARVPPGSCRCSARSAGRRAPGPGWPTCSPASRAA